VFHRTTGRLALAATAVALLAASMVAVFATAAHAADYSVDACTAQGCERQPGDPLAVRWQPE
jgi:hypothetical protein